MAKYDSSLIKKLNLKGLFIGENGGAWASGHDGVTNRYVSMFW